MQTSNILDLILINEDFVQNVSTLSPLGKSDHCMIHFQCIITVSNHFVCQKYKYDKGNYLNFSMWFLELIYKTVNTSRDIIFNNKCDLRLDYNNFVSDDLDILWISLIPLKKEY